MRIAVLVKQVPDTTDCRIDPETNTLCREGVDSIMNPFDTYALEEAVRIKEQLDNGSEVVAITMGPPQAESMLREAVSVGADRAVLVTDRAFAGGDTWATSLTLSKAIEKLDCSLVIAGKQAVDGDTAQVGPGVAMFLDRPQVTYVRKIEEITEEKMRVERMLETGFEVIELPLPAVITVVKEINEPRLPSLRGKMKAKKVEIEKLTLADFDIEAEEVGLTGSPTRVFKVFAPTARSGGEVRDGETPDLVKWIADELESTQII